MTAISDLISSLGVTLTLADDDMVTDVVVVAQVIEADGSVKLAVCDSDTTSWIQRLGMLRAAVQIESLAWSGPRGDDDD